MLYIGSCRYMYTYKWKYFPGRLHTTREILFFLNNIDNIQNILNKYPSELSDIIFGDICNPVLLRETNHYINTITNSVISSIEKIILEISSRKILYYNDIPINFYYVNYYKRNRHCIDLEKKYILTEHILTDDEINKDLTDIINLSKKIFSSNIQIHIIPHLNLKTKKTNEYILERNKLTILLEKICIENKINFHNIGKFIEKNKDGCYIDHYMNDSTHYNYGYGLVKQYLIDNIY